MTIVLTSSKECHKWYTISQGIKTVLMEQYANERPWSGS